MTVKHVSVDFWHTLAEPSAEYPLVRDTVLGGAYGVQPGIARMAYKRLKDRWEQDAVATGHVPPLDSLREQVNEIMGVVGSVTTLDSVVFQQLADRLSTEFLRHPPTVHQPVLDALQRLQDKGVTLSVGSNTNFIIRGRTISKLLDDELFEFQLYSDALGVCKPSPKFFAHVLTRAGAYCAVVEPDTVVHVGDSEVCDNEAARALGMRGLRCEDSEHLVSLLAELEKENA